MKILIEFEFDEKVDVEEFESELGDALDNYGACCDEEEDDECVSNHCVAWKVIE